MGVAVGVWVGSTGGCVGAGAVGSTAACSVGGGVPQAASPLPASTKTSNSTSIL
jgi:hypothetical protein